jgi:hypothetical protein
LILKIFLYFATSFIVITGVARSFLNNWLLKIEDEEITKKRGGEITVLCDLLGR